VCDPAAEWIFIVDRLNTHQSESLVRFIANQCGINAELGVKGKSGILESMPTRAAFLQDPTHRIRFVYTPSIRPGCIRWKSGSVSSCGACSNGPVSPL
jgi:hypothetical protein